MKCLVTGGSGGIGSHLCEHLRAHGHEVFRMDIKISTRHDIRNMYNCASIFETFKPEWVFHLAALADIVPSIERPFEYHRTNADGTVNLLECARQYGVDKFIYAASASCYGKNPSIPACEVDAIEPAYPYALTKWIGEQYVLHYAKVFGLRAVSLRLFNVYGRGLRTDGNYGAVIGTFLSQMAHGAPLTVVGDGTQKRDFVHVRDVVRAFLNAAVLPTDLEVYNIASGQAQSINDLVALLGAKNIVNIPKRPAEPEIIQAAIHRAKVGLSWVPEISFEDGIKELLTHLDDYWTAPLWTPEKIENETRAWFKHLS